MISKNRIKHIKALHQKKYRNEFQEFIIEGKKSVEEAIAFRNDFLIELFTTDESLLAMHSKISLITEAEMKQLSNLHTPGNLLALCGMWPAEEIKGPYVLALDGLQDPGNFGTIIRTADWFGVNDILCSPETADCFNPKVVQASMGSIFRINIRYEDIEGFVKNSTFPVYGTFMDGVSVFEEKIPDQAILVIGNEGNGISKEIERLVQTRLTIPRIGGGESLNAAVAAGVILSKISS